MQVAGSLVNKSKGGERGYMVKVDGRNDIILDRLLRNSLSQ